MCAWRQSANPETPSAERRAIGLLIEVAATSLLPIDMAAYHRFRSAILRDTIDLTEPQSESDLLNSVGNIIRGFKTHHTEAEAALEARQKAWRHVVAMLMLQVADRDEIDQQSDSWQAMRLSLTTAVTADEILSVGAELSKAFLKSREERVAIQKAAEEEQDRSVANDNAAGLRGGGAAIEHVRKMISGARPGYVGLFRLNCLDVVGERFGQEGIQDCLMAVSAFLIESLRKEDSVYHWSESSLLAVCDRKIREDILSAELHRVLSHNRDFTIQIGNSRIMLRIPIELELFPITLFESAEDLQKLSARRGRNDHPLAERAVARLNS
jgi:GGDEF domain-containing protein